MAPLFFNINFAKNTSYITKEKDTFEQQDVFK